MEASQAQAAAAPAADGQQGAAEGQQADGGQDIGQVLQTLEAMQGSQEQMRELLMSEPWRQQVQEVQDQEPELDLSFLDPESAGFDPASAAERLAQTMDQRAETRAQQLVEQRLGPLEQRITENERAAEATRLVEEFPELGDPEIGPQVVTTAGEYATAHFPPEIAKVMSNTPAFWRLVYMAGRAAESANEEGSVDPAAAHLEGGGGAMPSGAQQADLGEQIISAGRRGRSALPFG